MMGELLDGLRPFERQLSEMINEHLLERHDASETASGVAGVR
jgi:hypothetical protein